jgi:transposase-like protein
MSAWWRSLRGDGAMTTERSGTRAQASGKGTRRKHSLQFKRQAVLESLKPGASARQVAHRHGLHESLVGVWRRMHSQGRLQQTQSTVAEVKLLPVQVPTEAQGRVHRVAASIAPQATVPGAIHIEFSHGHRLSVRGEVDASALSVMIQALSRS